MLTASPVTVNITAHPTLTGRAPAMTPLRPASVPDARTNRAALARAVTWLSGLGLSVALGVTGREAAAQELTGTLKKVRDAGAIVVGHRDSSIPFSYLDDRQAPIGYSVDLCLRVVDAVKDSLKMPGLKVQMQAVTSSNRIPLLQNGTVDLECGSTTNSVERQRQVAFGYTTFVTNVRVVVKRNSSIRSLADLNGRPVATTSGTTSVQLLRAHEKARGVDFREVYGKDHAESFLLLETDRAAAFVMDDILIAGLVANSRNPQDYRFLDEVLRTEPYGIMIRRDDPAFKKVVDDTLERLMKSGEVTRLYNRWFTQPIPPNGVNLAFPMSKELTEAIRSPNDRGI
jgi:glutamate/aspartate transport system substrate-binding protein